MSRPGIQRIIAALCVIGAGALGASASARPAPPRKRSETQAQQREQRGREAQAAAPPSQRLARDAALERFSGTWVFDLQSLEALLAKHLAATGSEANYEAMIPLIRETLKPLRFVIQGDQMEMRGLGAPQRVTLKVISATGDEAVFESVTAQGTRSETRFRFLKPGLIEIHASESQQAFPARLLMKRVGPAQLEEPASPPPTPRAP